MQRDYWYTTACGASGLETAQTVGRKAGERCIARLGARRIPTCDAAVLYDPIMASGLIGHFVGAGNRLGMLPALVPRLRTYLVPWLAGGRKRLPLVADSDMAHAFVQAAAAEGLNDYESFNICGPAFPTTCRRLKSPRSSAASRPPATRRLPSFCRICG